MFGVMARGKIPQSTSRFQKSVHPAKKCFILKAIEMQHFSVFLQERRKNTLQKI